MEAGVFNVQLKGRDCHVIATSRTVATLKSFSSCSSYKSMFELDD